MPYCEIIKCVQPEGRFSYFFSTLNLSGTLNSTGQMHMLQWC